MRELALFAGIGGGILAGKELGWECVCAVEIDTFCQSILLKRQQQGFLKQFPIWDDVRTFDGSQWRGKVDIISGGFPCQDISAAGTGKGIEGERSGLWMHFARIIGEVRPQYCFIENSPRLVQQGLSKVLSDLDSLGYNAAWCVIGANAASAPHKRERIWIKASLSDANDLRQL
jgi:DNA (cytosine-5)-methyltransferase 1